jgi:NADPH:quinone reductase-like Zn-dependent oxidoreductase
MARDYRTEVPMKAIQAAYRGGYDALRLVDIPQPQSRAGHALVRVTSAGVTPLDRTVLAGLHPTARKLPLVPGNEGAGVVIEDASGRFSGFSLFAASAGEQAEAYATVLPLIAGGQITPARDRSFPLERGAEALRHLIEDRPFGKVTLTVRDLPAR